MWQSKKDWDRYRDSDARKEHEDAYADMFEGSTEYEIFRVGM
jgi:heme-degrading monooxygenase HmoA